MGASLNDSCGIWIRDLNFWLTTTNSAIFPWSAVCLWGVWAIPTIIQYKCTTDLFVGFTVKHSSQSKVESLYSVAVEST